MITQERKDKAMEWIDCIQGAVDFIEEHILEPINYEDAADFVHFSPYHFHRMFSVLTGMTIGEYIRNRRLSIAGEELTHSDTKIIDIALKYGYDTPENFTKAFVRFHGVAPSKVKSGGVNLHSFNPLKIIIKLEGGTVMNYQIVEKEAFTVVGVSKLFKFDSAYQEVPKFWDEFMKNPILCGMFGVNIDNCEDRSQFEYLIAENYIPWKEVPKGCKAVTIPKFTWAIFPCKMSNLQQTNTRIYSEWLPNCKEYEIGGHYAIEMYYDPKDFPNGVDDENYGAEIWIPVKKK